MANKVSYLIFHITGIRDCLNVTRLLSIMHYLMPVVQFIYFYLSRGLSFSESAVFIKCYY